jgi:hypothetical protein
MHCFSHNNILPAIHMIPSFLKVCLKWFPIHNSLHLFSDGYSAYKSVAPETTKQLPEDYVELVKRVHESGGYGSRGYDFSHLIYFFHYYVNDLFSHKYEIPILQIWIWVEKRGSKQKSFANSYNCNFFSDALCASTGVNAIEVSYISIFLTFGMVFNILFCAHAFVIVLCFLLFVI